MTSSWHHNDDSSIFNQDQVLHLPVPPLEHLLPDVNIIASEKCEFAHGAAFAMINPLTGGPPVLFHISQIIGAQIQTSTCLTPHALNLLISYTPRTCSSSLWQARSRISTSFTLAWLRCNSFSNSSTRFLENAFFKKASLCLNNAFKRASLKPKHCSVFYQLPRSKLSGEKRSL